MCLISFNWLDHPRYKLILVANRDEYFKRNSASLHLWPQGFYAGKDLQRGGTWMGIHPKGKFAALTNYRTGEERGRLRLTRGNLVKDFLENEESPLEYLRRVEQKKEAYHGFNLLLSDGSEMLYLSNHLPEILTVDPGLHGISNAFLDTPWPKVVSAKNDLMGLIARDGVDEQSLMELLQDKEHAPDEQLPSTGVPLDIEKALSAQFLQWEGYGTVNTTGILWSHEGEVVMIEKRTHPAEENRVQFTISQEGSQ